MSPDLAGHLLDGILSALEHAHRAGIVHRDLKPANIMITQLGGIKIMDFGIARVRGAEHMTIDGCTVGTPAYMAPEQILGEEIDGRTDLYAVGIVLYRLLAGRLPFDADNPMVMLQKQIAETPPPLHAHRQGLPDWCETIVKRALEKSPADRFQTAEEFRAAVGRAIGLAPSIDLAKAFAVSGAGTAPKVADPAPLETVAVSRTHARSPRRRTTVARATETARAKTTSSFGKAGGRRTAALLASIAALGAVAYLASGALAIESGKGGGSKVRAEERSSSMPARPVERSGTGTIAAAPPPLIFETKILVRAGREQRQEDARLSLARGRVSVAPYGALDEPVFSVPYEGITAIRYSREPMWKPPQKLSRVIRLGDDVLDKFGIRDRHQISLYAEAEDRVVVLRVDERVAPELLKALKERTRRNLEIVAER